MPWATDEGLCGVVACQPGRHVYGAAVELHLCPSRSCWPRARAQEGQVLAVEHVLDEPGLNCDLSSGICADDDVLDALRRDQERVHLRSRRARRPGTTRKHESTEVVTFYLLYLPETRWPPELQ